MRSALWKVLPIALFLLTPGGASAQSSVLLWELSTGQADLNDTDYVILRVVDLCTMDGLALVVEDDAGVSQGCYLRFAGPPPVSDGFILIGGVGVEDAYGYAPDFLAECAPLQKESGRICLVDGSGLLDCVAYGQFIGDNTGFGSPADGVFANQSLERIQTTGLNSIDWQRFASADPADEVGGRLLPPGGVSCATDGGTVDGGATDGGLDASYLEDPDGGLCPTSTFGQAGGADGGSSDGGATDGGTSADGGGTVVPAGGGGSQPYEGSSCSSTGDAGSGHLALLVLLVGLTGLAGIGRRRRD